MIAQLGEGGGAKVYLAVASSTAGVNKLLVIKVLRPEVASDPQTVDMFMDEARLSTRLNHPAVVQIIEAGQENDLYFMVMEYLDGKAFARLDSERIPGLGRNALIHLITEALGGLHYAHELVDYDGKPLGVVHRDVSPSNLFVTYDGHVKLLDFGVAKTLNSSTQTEFGIVKGKPRYMAPEHALGEQVDRRADIFSMGVVLWETIARRRMFAGKNDLNVLYAVTNGDIPSLAEAAPDAPEDLVKIVNRALAPARDDRYPTAAAMQEELEQYLRQTGEVIQPRAIGKALSDHFSEDRATLKAAIDAQLLALVGSSGEFRVVSLNSSPSIAY